MKDFLIYIFESSVCLTVFYCVYLTFRNETFFGFIRYYLVLGIFISFILPMFQYSYDVYVISPQQTLNYEQMDTNAEKTIDKIDLYTFLGYIFLLGSISLLCVNCFTFIKMLLLKKRSELSTYKNITVVDNKKISHPHSLFRHIYINKDNFTEKEVITILNHESLHINQHHWIDLTICQLLILLQWFNPIIWLYIKSIKENHEFLVDRDMIFLGHTVSDYKKILINQMFNTCVYSLKSSFYYSLSKRFIMMTKKQSSSIKKGTALALIPLFSVLMWASVKPNYIISQTSPIYIQDSIMPMAKNSHNDKLLVIDGVTYPSLNIDLIDSIYIESVQVLDKDLAIKIYGSNAENGVLEVKLKQGYDYSALKKSNSTIQIDSSATIIVNGKKVSKEEFEKIGVSKIKNFEVRSSDNGKRNGEKTIIVTTID